MLDISTWNVVFIDDEPDNVRVVEFILQFHKASLRSAEDGPKGLELLRANKPTFLLLDIRLPLMSGWEILDVIRSDAQLKDLPVIAVTAHAMSGDKEKALKAGFDGYITKPISAMTFIDDIKSILQVRKRHE